MPNHCCVPLCTNRSSLERCKDLSFHRFPKAESRRKLWIQNIRRDPGDNFKITSATSVCSVHFTPEDYRESSIQGKLKRLTRNAVPTIFSWKPLKEPRRKPTDRSAIIGPCYQEITPPSTPRPQPDQNSPPQAQLIATPQASPSTNNELLDNSYISLPSPNSPTKEYLQKQNLTLHQLRSSEKFCLTRFASSNSAIKYYTGFPSYQQLIAFYHFLQPECNFLYYVGTDNTSEGKTYDEIKKRGPNRTLPPIEELFITLVRLRKGIQERIIADLYDMSEGHISKIINTWVLFLADRLKFLPIWPTKTHVAETMPNEFQALFPTTRIIIDCTEIFIEQPSASNCQRETFSSYKHHNTAKGLLGISPSGQITFISRLYAGRCSDKKIIRHCGLLDMLEDGDHVMADRGFDIEDDLHQRGAALTMPPFLSGQDQFTEEQLNKTRSIAAVRVHVERAVRKVKEFEILRNIVPISLCPMLEKIWFVCSHLANFTGSLIKQ